MKAFLVVGPRSSGARFITSAIIKAGAFGQADYSQQMDNPDFSGRADPIVLWRTVPHGDDWPELHQIIQGMQAAGYAVMPIITYRDKDYCIQSQLRGANPPDEAKARANYFYAYKHIYRHFAAARLLPVACHYASFVSNAEYRTLFFQQLGLMCPELELYDANLKYPDVLPKISEG
jgi:hypothetical protein